MSIYKSNDENIPTDTEAYYEAVARCLVPAFDGWDRE
jgi:hypothetical protein